MVSVKLGFMKYEVKTVSQIVSRTVEDFSTTCLSTLVNVILIVQTHPTIPNLEENLPNKKFGHRD